MGHQYLTHPAIAVGTQDGSAGLAWAHNAWEFSQTQREDRGGCHGATERAQPALHVWQRVGTHTHTHTHWAYLLSRLLGGGRGSYEIAWVLEEEPVEGRRDRNSLLEPHSSSLLEPHEHERKEVRWASKMKKWPTAYSKNGGGRTPKIV